MPAILETARQRVETSAHEPSGCIISTDGGPADRYSASTCSRMGNVPAQMGAGPGADVGAGPGADVGRSMRPAGGRAFPLRGACAQWSRR